MKRPANTAIIVILALSVATSGRSQTTGDPLFGPPIGGLLAAADAGDLELVKELVERKGADIEQRHPAQEKSMGHHLVGYTPIAMAALNGHLDVVKYLIKKKAKNRDRALLAAARGGHLPVVKYLVRHGARSKRAKTAAMVEAFRQENMEVGKFLLARGADVNGLVYGGEVATTPLVDAVASGDLEVVKLLVSKGAKVNRADEYNTTPLLDAVRFGHVEIVKYLLSKKAKVSARDNSGEGVMHHAADNGSVPLAELLVAHGAELNPESEYGTTPLDKAISEGHTEMVTYLLGQGAAPTESALITALKRGRVKIAEMLVDAGCDTGPLKDRGYEVLSGPVWKNDLAVAKFLLEAGVDPNEVRLGATVLDHAEEKGHTEMVALLESHGAVRGEELSSDEHPCDVFLECCAAYVHALLHTSHPAKVLEHARRDCDSMRSFSNLAGSERPCAMKLAMLMEAADYYLGDPIPKECSFDNIPDLGIEGLSADGVIDWVPGPGPYEILRQMEAREKKEQAAEGQGEAD